MSNIADATYSNQDVDVQELEAEFGFPALEPYPLEPELTGDDIEDAMLEFQDRPLEDRITNLSNLGHAILTRGVTR